jgi:hypothetical protein
VKRGEFRCGRCHSSKSLLAGREPLQRPESAPREDHPLHQLGSRALATHSFLREDLGLSNGTQAQLKNWLRSVCIYGVEQFESSVKLGREDLMVEVDEMLFCVYFFKKNRFRACVVGNKTQIKQVL